MDQRLRCCAAILRVLSDPPLNGAGRLFEVVIPRISQQFILRPHRRSPSILLSTKTSKPAAICAWDLFGSFQITVHDMIAIDRTRWVWKVDWGDARGWAKLGLSGFASRGQLGGLYLHSP